MCVCVYIYSISVLCLERYSSQVDIISAAFFQVMHTTKTN